MLIQVAGRLYVWNVIPKSSFVYHITDMVRKPKIKFHREPVNSVLVNSVSVKSVDCSAGSAGTIIDFEKWGGLPWGLDSNPHTLPIPYAYHGNWESPRESPYSQQPQVKNRSFFPHVIIFFFLYSVRHHVRGDETFSDRSVSRCMLPRLPKYLSLITCISLIRFYVSILLLLTTMRSLFPSAW